MGTRRVRIERIADARLRQMVFTKRKNGVMRRAMELSVLCDCDVAVIVFDSRGRLCQYSSGGMDDILVRYSRACSEPHESHTTEDLYHHCLLEKLEWQQEGPPARKRQRSMPFILAAAAAVAAQEEAEQEAAEAAAAAREQAESEAAATEAAGARAAQADGEGAPAAAEGKAADEEGAEEGAPPLTPRSAQAYGRIVREFDRLIKQVEVEMETTAAVEAKPSPEQLRQQEEEEEQARAAAAAAAAARAAPGEGQGQANGGRDEEMQEAGPAAGTLMAGTPSKGAQQQQQQQAVAAAVGTPAGAPSTTLDACPGAPGPVPLLGLPSLNAAGAGAQPPQQQSIVATARLHYAAPQGLPTAGQPQPAASMQTGASALTAAPLFGSGAAGLQAQASGQSTPRGVPTLFALPVGSTAAAGMAGAGRGGVPMAPQGQPGQLPQLQLQGQGVAGRGGASPSTPTALGISVPTAGSATSAGPLGLVPAHLMQQMQQAMQAQGFSAGNIFLRPMLAGGGAAAGNQPAMATLIPASAMPGAGGGVGQQRLVLQLHPAAAAAAAAAAAGGAAGGGAVQLPARPMAGAAGVSFAPAAPGPPASSALPAGSLAMGGAPGGLRAQQHHLLFPTGAGGQQGMVCGVMAQPGGMLPGGRGMVGLMAQPSPGGAAGMVPASQLGGGQHAAQQQQAQAQAQAQAQLAGAAGLPAAMGSGGAAAAAAGLPAGLHFNQHFQLPAASASQVGPPASAAFAGGLLAGVPTSAAPPLTSLLSSLHPSLVSPPAPAMLQQPAQQGLPPPPSPAPVALGMAPPGSLTALLQAPQPGPQQPLPPPPPPPQQQQQQQQVQPGPLGGLPPQDQQVPAQAAVDESLLGAFEDVVAQMLA